MVRWLVCLAAVAVLGCSGSPGEAVSTDTQAVVPAGCQASSLACDGSWLSADALANATWSSLQCPATTVPNVPAVLVGSEKIGCLGTWIGNYTPTAAWHWCCPAAK